MSPKAYNILLTLLVLAISAIGILAAAQAPALMEDAIKHGVAEYYLDADNNRQFRWKECGE